MLDFNNLSPNSKCWIYITKNEISKSELENLEIGLNNIGKLDVSWKKN